MSVLIAIFENPVILMSLLSWFAAQLGKVILILITKRRIDFSRFVGSGGMPSSHASFTCALAIGVGRTAGFGSPLFAVTFVFSLIVMYDASGVRRAAGQQAQILNKIVEHWNDNDQVYMEKKLKELLGHTPFEVLVGAILGIIIGFLFPIA